MSAPAVTVLMAVYNGAEHLREAVDSILAQTFSNFEFVIVDDASTDATPQILREYAKKDSRLRILCNDTNQERCFSRNRGIEAARFDLIAVMDADDIAMPDRLEKQIAFMQAHPEISVCGSALSIHDAPDKVWLPPLEHESIRVKLFFESCLYHPTAIYRKQPIRAAEGYDTAMPPTEDYDLWARLSMLPSTRFANLSDILLRYRIYPKDKYREKYKETQKHQANRVREKLLRHLGLIPSDEEFSAHLALSLYRRDLSLMEILTCKRWLDKLRKAALSVEHPYDEKALNHELEFRWAILCRENKAASAFGLLYLCSRFASLKYIAGFGKNILRKMGKNTGGKPG